MATQTDELIQPLNYPQLAGLVWSGRPDQLIAPEEALSIYERNWRFIELETLTAAEAALIDRLASNHGNGHLLVGNSGALEDVRRKLG